MILSKRTVLFQGLQKDCKIVLFLFLFLYCFIYYLFARRIISNYYSSYYSLMCHNF